MRKKQMAQAVVLASMITVLFEYLMFYHAWLLINGSCTLGIFACIFFLVVLVWTKGAILPNPYPYCHVVLKKREKEDE